MIASIDTSALLRIVLRRDARISRAGVRIRGSRDLNRSHTANPRPDARGRSCRDERRAVTAPGRPRSRERRWRAPPYRLVRQVRAEADADVERSVEVQGDRRAERVHRFAFQADEERERVAALFDADALGHDGDQAVRTGAARTAAAADAILHVLDADALLRALRQVDHARAVQRHDRLLANRHRDPGE